MKKLAVLFPGIGYTMDRPLLHFCRRIAANHGYEIKQLHFTGFPSDVRGDREKMELCYILARVQTRDQLLTVAALHVYNQKSTYRGLLSDDYLDHLDPADLSEKWEEFSRQDGQAIFVAWSKTGLQGFAACKKDTEYTDCLYLDALHVAPEARGQGVGTDLIRRVGQYGRENGFQTMSVCIVKGNDEARELYTKLGAVHMKDFTDHFEGTISQSEKLRWRDLSFAD